VFLGGSVDLFQEVVLNLNSPGVLPVSRLNEKDAVCEKSNRISEGLSLLSR
jgi:hypothetical protein